MLLPSLTHQALGISHGVPSNGGQNVATQRAQGYVQASIGTLEQGKATTPHGRRGEEQKPCG